MARQPRLDLPEIPQHNVRRGNNRLPCVLDDVGLACYRHLLHEASRAIGCRLHAYVLMNNHVHLLATPPATGARMTDDPAAFPWSSCAALRALRQDPLLTLHPTQYALGATDWEPGEAYRELLAEALNDEDLEAIRAYLQQQRAYGRDDFQEIAQAPTDRFAKVRPAHRPARSTNIGSMG